MDPAELQWHTGEVVGVGREKWSRGVHDQAPQRVAGLGDRLADQALESFLSLDLRHHRVHHVVGALVHADQESRLLPGGEDRLAAHAEEPAPGGRPKLHRDLHRGLGPSLSWSTHPFSVNRPTGRPRRCSRSTERTR